MQLVKLVFRFNVYYFHFDFLSPCEFSTPHDLNSQEYMVVTVGLKQSTVCRADTS